MIWTPSQFLCFFMNIVFCTESDNQNRKCAYVVYGSTSFLHLLLYKYNLGIAAVPGQDLGGKACRAVWGRGESYYISKGSMGFVKNVQGAL